MSHVTDVLATGVTAELEDLFNTFAYHTSLAQNVIPTYDDEKVTLTMAFAGILLGRARFPVLPVVPV